MAKTALRKGEIVSCGYAVGTIITGRVVELKRRADGVPFLMIEFTSGRRQGERDWPDVAWQLGVGPHESTCRKCDRAFRYQPGDDGFFCATCNHQDAELAYQQSRDPSRRSSSWDRKQLRHAGEKHPVRS
jgi:hypothetical protein